MSDVQFAVGRDYGAQKTFPAHKVIMGVRSAVFHTMFYGSLPDNCKTPIDIPDVPPDAFENMLSYIYTDAVKDFTLDNVFHTLKCADKYDLPLLVAQCTEFVMGKLNVNNCLAIIDNAMHYAGAAPSILEQCLRLVDESAKTVWEAKHFSKIGEEALRIILQRDTLTANEHTILSSVNMWAMVMCLRRKLKNTSAANRREVLGQALFLIRFPLLTHAQLLDGPIANGLLLQSEGMDIFRYKHATIKPELPFSTKPRQNIRAKAVINYTVPDVRKLKEKAMFSEPVTVRKLLWSVQVNHNTKEGFPALSLFLVCDGYPESEPWSCQINAELRLLPWTTGTAAVNRQISRLFDKDTNSWGWSEYISMENLLNPARGYVNPSDFSLKLQVELSANLPTGIE
ncbi:BTB/POZ domain-containing protein 3-like [Paramacrobiotus metropolitanus]|uniref:BTB/POZ domain-containing protein 3-like n=1 Tax=Paramacrobiotus metropolitanus TaxID=2943436 RepID=UPI002445EDC4|nr:BTB/POZ domain-containing protein 3-like [Paramacrobiotus metropolitanus]